MDPVDIVSASLCGTGILLFFVALWLWLSSQFRHAEARHALRVFRGDLNEAVAGVELLPEEQAEAKRLRKSIVRPAKSERRHALYAGELGGLSGGAGILLHDLSALGFLPVWLGVLGLLLDSLLIIMVLTAWVRGKPFPKDRQM